MGSRLLHPRLGCVRESIPSVMWLSYELQWRSTVWESRCRQAIWITENTLAAFGMSFIGKCLLAGKLWSGPTNTFQLWFRGCGLVVKSRPRDLRENSHRSKCRPKCTRNGSSLWWWRTSGLPTCNHKLSYIIAGSAQVPSMSLAPLLGTMHCFTQCETIKS